jgi:hypothetical protein
MADPALVARLVEALMHARHQLLTLNNCSVSDAPGVEGRLPAELRKLFWHVDSDPVLDATARALAEAAAARFTGPDVLEPPEQAASASAWWSTTTSRLCAIRRAHFHRRGPPALCRIEA